MSASPHRSFEKINQDDLARLAQIARDDLADLCRRSEFCRPFADRLRLLCLCQGAARHYLHGDRGVQDFDVWGFFAAIPGRAFPCRRRGARDFGPSKFGRNPDDGEGFNGRRVDVIGRSIAMAENETSIASAQRYLREKRTMSARLLSQRPVIGLWPQDYCGRLIWSG